MSLHFGSVPSKNVKNIAHSMRTDQKRGIVTKLVKRGEQGLFASLSPLLSLPPLPLRLLGEDLTLAFVCSLLFRLEIH